ncbi:site-specific integrase [Streptomyces flavotricini]|uniref:Site-specific integrase n=1 Tax=Streptomyces flavotricini TaxID=66888 RepID=A0ABS8E9P2_9ACTN|nr:site-specific integrase [Streptomyces flavotricini]
MKNRRQGGTHPVYLRVHQPLIIRAVERVVQSRPVEPEFDPGHRAQRAIELHHFANLVGHALADFLLPSAPDLRAFRVSEQDSGPNTAGRLQPEQLRPTRILGEENACVHQHADLPFRPPEQLEPEVSRHVRTVRVAAAVDDGLITKNPCRARSVQVPKPAQPRVAPWTPTQVIAVRAALPGHLRTAVDVASGCGLRQGEVFGLDVEELDYDGEWVRVQHQLKRIRGKYVFALPKGGKTRSVPLPRSVAAALRAHSKLCPPVKVTLPWRTPAGPPVTKSLIFSGSTGNFVRVSYFNDFMWKPALALAGIIPPADEGERYASAPQHGMHALRHFYASVLLDAGENIRALSQYLGHADPGFTLRTYTHLMPSSEGRTRKAVDGLFGAPPDHDHGPETAQ